MTFGNLNNACLIYKNIIMFLSKFYSIDKSKGQ